MAQPPNTFAVFEDDDVAVEWLRTAGVIDLEQGKVQLQALQQMGLTPDLLGFLIPELAQQLPLLGDPDLALETLNRYFEVALNPLSTVGMFQREPETLRILLTLFSSSGLLGEVLTRDPAAFELVRLTDGNPVQRQPLIDEITAEISKLSRRAHVLAALRRYKQREMLRIAYGDVIRQQPIATVTQQISYLADAICSAALGDCRRRMEGKYGVPSRPDGRPAEFVVIALGKLGGNELSYSPRLELLFVYDGDGQTNGSRRLENAEFFSLLAADLMAVLSGNERPDFGRAYQLPAAAEDTKQIIDDIFRVDASLRPDAGQSPLAVSFQDAFNYYDWRGRTWERQALIKARPVAGDAAMGQRLLTDLEPWIYRRMLSRADKTGIKALKRRIERRLERVGAPGHDVISCQGGIDDVEFAIQFLQLINGGELKNVRVGNTLDGIEQLHASQCIDDDERKQLVEGYCFLRRVEHLVQIMLARTAAVLPNSERAIAKLAIHLGYRASSDETSVKQFRDDLQRHQIANRAIVNHLLGEVFSESTEPIPAVEFDLILDPAPPLSIVRDTLSPYGFRDPNQAYRNLMTLATEPTPFLSARRCRHAMAAIAPALLTELAKAPRPDEALTNLCRVSESLGGKGVLWELFSAHPPSLRLYVSLCSTSRYLATILISHPGMLDELMDSLMLSQLPDRALLHDIVDEWCRGRGDLSSQLLSFKHVQHLNAGVRDILGKETVRQTTAFLADVAQVCLRKVCDAQWDRMVDKYGSPWHETENRPCELIMVALGKLGGREPNYHSDLDVLFLYETDGTTRDGTTREGGSGPRSTSHQHFFNELAQRVSKAVNQLGPNGRLYELDTKLRPTGQLAASVSSFVRQFQANDRPILERLAVCRARPIYGSTAVRESTTDAIHGIAQSTSWQHAWAGEILAQRIAMQSGAAEDNLKRGPGGLVDVELMVQAYQLRHAATHPSILVTGTVEGLQALRTAELISADEAETLTSGYRWLRSVEARLRLMDTAARHDLPADAEDLEKLASLCGAKSAKSLREKTQSTMSAIRSTFETGLRRI